MPFDFIRVFLTVVTVFHWLKTTRPSCRRLRNSLITQPPVDLTVRWIRKSVDVVSRVKPRSIAISHRFAYDSLHQLWKAVAWPIHKHLPRQRRHTLVHHRCCCCHWLICHHVYFRGSGRVSLGHRYLSYISMVAAAAWRAPCRRQWLRVIVGLRRDETTNRRQRALCGGISLAHAYANWLQRIHFTFFTS